MRKRVSLFGMEIDAVTMPDAVATILRWADGRAGPCRYVTTPNVDHVVRYQEDARLREAYTAASLVLADGKPVVWASRCLGCPLPGTVPGSDLAPAIFASATGGLRIFLLGAAPGVAPRAAAAILRAWPWIEVVGHHSPPPGFEHSEEESRRIIDRVRHASPQLLIVGFGVPKQEIWVHRHQLQLEARVALCLGATIDFLAGEKRRAPKWMRHAGLEWAHRLLCEPRRLASRYARDAWVFPRLIWREWRALRRT